ncbi:DUF3798 domain-containing protein [Tissierella creatinini]|nr:DUF3798 domain-containing protein [Tissierella creatinini]TJX64575.1 DUF3798 domain-containing protein [Soehngenia saccharolytica]
MKKRLMVLLLALAMTFNLAACAGEPKKEEVAEVPASGEVIKETEAPSYKIGIITPTLSSSEDEFRAGDNMVKKYPGIVKHLTFPENVNAEMETALSQIVSLADDPDMKAIIIASGGSGYLPGLQKVKEKRPDIITITAPIWDDPELMAKYVDINLDTDWARRGVTIVEKAHDMGAKTFIHYSFPTHLAKEVISLRKDTMKETAEKLGMEFVEVVTPDPQTGDGTAPMLQFLREDVPRQIEKYGPDTNIFGSNCPMYDVILDEALKLKFLVAEQCCPTPTQAYPTVMGLEIAEEDSANFDKINAMISEKAKEAGMTGRLSGWPMPVTIFLPEYAVELAKYAIDNNSNLKEDVLNKEFLDKFAKDTFGVGVDFQSYQQKDNYYMMIMESIFY